MGLVVDEHAVEQLVPAGLDPSFDQGFHLRYTDGAGTTLMPTSVRMASNRPGYLPSRSRIRYFTRQPASSTSITRFGTAWVTRAVVGCAVAPRTRTRRVACSMTARTYRREPVKVTV